MEVCFLRAATRLAAIDWPNLGAFDAPKPLVGEDVVWCILEGRAAINRRRAGSSSKERPYLRKSRVSEPVKKSLSTQATRCCSGVEPMWKLGPT